MNRSVRMAQRIAVLSAVLVAACDDDVLTPSSRCAELQPTSSAAAGAPLGDLSRVRISLVSRFGADAASGEAVRSAGVRLQKNGRCFRLSHAAATRLGSVEGMTGSVVADVLVEPGTISQISIAPGEGSGGRTIGAGTLSLDTPVELEAGLRTEIFIALDSVAGSGELKPRFVAAGQVPLDAGTVIVAEPGRAGSLSLRGGFAMEWPGDATRQPAVFGISESDVGGVTPYFNVMPAGNLAGLVRVTLPMTRARMPEGFAMSDYGVQMGGQALRTTTSGNNVSFDARATGALSLSSDRPFMELSDGTRIASPATPGAALRSGQAGVCRDRLAANRATYMSRLANGSQGIRITDCEAVAPYVHIVMVNLSSAKPSTASYPRMYLPAEWYTNTNTFLLHTINEHAQLKPGIFTVINGFTWDGDSGAGTGSGVPRGSLIITYLRKSPPYQYAEALIGFGTPSATGSTPAAFFSKPAGTTAIDLGAYSHNAVPTTTSIIRNGACNGEGLYDRWSALGVGNGVLVLVSSTSGGASYDTELCEVFQGLNVMGGAIRLDGGPSAALSWIGTHLNPLSGAASLRYGSARHVAYGVGVMN